MNNQQKLREAKDMDDKIMIELINEEYQTKQQQIIYSCMVNLNKIFLIIFPNKKLIKKIIQKFQTQPKQIKNNS